MPNVVKRFWYVKECTSYFPPIIKGLVDLISDKSWLMLESPDLNPDWFWNIKSFLMKKENMLFCSNISKIFPHIGRSETGLYPPGNKTSCGRRNDASVEHRQDLSVVCLHDVLLVCRDDVSRGRNDDVPSVRLHDVSNKSQMKHPKTSQWYVTKTSQWYVSTTSH